MRGVGARRLAGLFGLAGLVGLAAMPTLAGCGGEPGLAEATYPQLVPPAVQQAPDQGEPQQLSAAGLRLVDPCTLLDTAVLARYGTPDDNVAQDFDGCRNYMRDANGESLSMSVRVGEIVTRGELDKAIDQVGEFRARVSTIEGACFVTLVADHLDPVVGVTLQARYKAADPCPAAREVAADIGRRLTTTATVREPKPGSLLPLDPCALPGVLPARAVPGALEPDPFGLHQCTWRSPGGAEIELEFAYRFDPATPGGPVAPVHLGGGVTGHKLRTEQTFTKCQLGWMHLPSTGDLGEIVEIEVRDVGDTGIDVCASATTFARGLLPKLPKP